MASEISAAHSAVILAAGASQRLGYSKLWLRQRGESLLAKTVRLAQATAPQALYVITGAERERIEAALAGQALHCVYNPRWQSGLASSLQTAATQLATDDGMVLVLSCDQPLLSLTHLTALLQAHTTQPTHNIVTAYADTIGVPALIRAACLQASQSLRGDRGLKSVLLVQSERLQTLPADALAFDLDTPQDVAHAIAQGWLDADAIH